MPRLRLRAPRFPLRLRPLAALLGLLLALSPTPATAQEAPPDESVIRVRSSFDARVARVSSARRGVASVGDTAWIGYRAGQTNNYWKIGVGPNRPGTGTDGYWDFDHPVHGDSLMGWWPIRRAHVNSAGAVLPDVQRPWWAAETGNNANYVINQGRFDVTRLGTAYPGNRTFGVVGVWHSDPGNTTPGLGVTWAPLVGTRSAWMGLRRHNDLTAMDPITGNPFNATVLAFMAASSQRTYPGYSAQMDQMLYRDLDLSGAPVDSGVRITFRYRTQMSTGKGTNTSTRTGWYEGDPLTLNTDTPGNFISAEAGVPANSQAPVDSFQVYVGAPVEDTWKGSDNQTRSIYDPLRRWFNEVLAKDTRFWKFGKAGADSGQVTLVITKAQKDAIVAATGSPRLRVVFRVHTNAGTSDDSGPLTYTSNGRGAAQVDDVRYDAGLGAVTIGDFEGSDPAKTIDNLQPASAAWRSTGKPPATRMHTHDVASLLWEDLCGLPGSSTSRCDMRGAVLSMGDHDRSEATAGPEDTPERAGRYGVMSPTIGLKASGPSTPNTFDITGDMAAATEYLFAYQTYTGAFDYFNTGNAWYFGGQYYPVTLPDGTPGWSEMRQAGFTYFNPVKECYLVADYLKSNGIIPSFAGVPDSIRVFWVQESQCYRFGVTTGCGPATGGYLDHISIGLLRASTAPMTVDIWDWFHDTFPATLATGLAGTAAFDTTTAYVKTGHNVAQSTGNLQRYDVPGDTLVVLATGTDTRIDLVFRIKPGPGNLVTVGDPSSGVRRVPTAPAPAAPGDGSWWGTWMSVPGDFASPGAVALHAGWPGGWNPNAWMSARCDTAQLGLFPVEWRLIGDHPAALAEGRWMSTYHESDPHLATLGIPRRECFLVDTAASLFSNGSVTCTTVPAWVTANPVRAGYDGNPITVEGTKIIPDGLLTPGSHVEYFLRRSLASAPAVATALMPDTGTVVPQVDEGSLDGHRWQQFGVLPDLWKDARFGGDGLACMLVIDLADRRGDELAWVSIADSSGWTAPTRRGAHDGWRGSPGADLNDPAVFVAAHGGQPGTTWDLYQIKAGESYNAAAGSIGSRLAYPPPVGDAVAGKTARLGPSLEMLTTYYKNVILLTGDLNSGLLGPFNDHSADDKGLLTSFVQGSTVAEPRGIVVFGDQFFSDLAGDPFLPDVLGAQERYLSVSSTVGTYDPVLDLVVDPPLSASGEVFGVRAGCRADVSVLQLDPAMPEAAPVARYGVSMPDPFIAAIHKPATATRPWVALSHGFSVQRLVTRNGASTLQRALYANRVGQNLFGSVCPVGSVELSVSPGGPVFADGMRLFNTPLAHGDATVEFTLAAPDRVTIGFYDIGGRLVRTLAERTFPAGPQRLAWDGSDDAGRRLQAGVYFARVRYVSRGFESARKLIVLK